MLDDRGCLRIVGRAKDMFIVGGFNAYPAEIENALLRHPDIQQAAVIGIPDERLGEVGMAFVVLRAGAATTAPDIIAWCRDEMANYKARAIEVIDELPLNATGKVVKDELQTSTKAEGDSQSGQERREAPSLEEVLAQLLRQDRVSPSSPSSMSVVADSGGRDGRW